MDLLNSKYLSAKKQVFRLELLSYYRIRGENEDFKKYLKGESRSFDKDFDALCMSIKEDNVKGKQHIRVHVVPEKLTDYLKFEIEWYYKPRAEAGEKIYLLNQEEYEKLISEDFSPGDFYSFDGVFVLELIYDEGGSFLRVKEVKNIEPYIELKQKIIEKAVPLELFFT